MKVNIENDDRFFPRMIDHVLKSVSSSCQDYETSLIPFYLSDFVPCTSYVYSAIDCEMIISHKIQKLIVSIEK